MYISLDIDHFAQITIAVCPPKIDETAFKRHLKAKLKGFYYNPKAEPFKRLRHITSFTNTSIEEADAAGMTIEDFLDDEDGGEDADEFLGSIKFGTC